MVVGGNDRCAANGHGPAAAYIPNDTIRRARGAPLLTHQGDPNSMHLGQRQPAPEVQSDRLVHLEDRTVFGQETSVAFGPSLPEVLRSPTEQYAHAPLRAWE